MYVYMYAIDNTCIYLYTLKSIIPVCFKPLFTSCIPTFRLYCLDCYSGVVNTFDCTGW